jgi:hypothetical protein
MTALFSFVVLKPVDPELVRGQIDGDALLADSRFYRTLQASREPVAFAAKFAQTPDADLPQHHTRLRQLAAAAANPVQTLDDFRKLVAEAFETDFSDAAATIGAPDARRRLAERHLAFKIANPADPRLAAAAGMVKITEAVVAVATGLPDALWRMRFPGAQVVRYRRAPGVMPETVPARHRDRIAGVPIARTLLAARDRRVLTAGSDDMRAESTVAADRTSLLAAAERALRIEQRRAFHAPEPSGREDDSGGSRRSHRARGSANRSGKPGTDLPKSLMSALVTAGVPAERTDTLLDAETKLAVAMMIARDERRELRRGRRPRPMAFANGTWSLPSDPRPNLPDLLPNLPDLPSLPPLPVTPGARGAPTTKGSARVLGPGLLIRVVDTVLGYEPAALARVANFPRGMKRESEYRRKSRTEETDDVETVEAERTELTHESDERSNMKEESEKALNAEMSVRASTSVSLAYGPVGFEASGGMEASVGGTSMTHTATDFAKRVVDKAVSEIVKQQRAVRRSTRIVQTDQRELEGVDNVGSPNHVSAIYQWVDEVHQGQLMQYGTRLMLEFTVPEPGRNLVWAAENAPPSADEILPPPPFDIEIDDIDEWSYLDLGVRYGAGLLPAPPEAESFISKTLKAGDTITEWKDTRIPFAVTDESLVVPEGYRVTKVYAVIATVAAVDEKLDDARWQVEVGRFRRSRADGSAEYNLELRKERSQDLVIDVEDDEFVPTARNIPILLTGLENRPAAVSVTLRLARSTALFDSWRSEVFSALRKAHERLTADYDDRRAQRAQGPSGSGFTARAPGRQRQIEREEIKRAVLEILTGQHFDAFGAIRPDAITGRPLIDFSEAAAEGAYVRFFETAIEWENIEYVLYPYFWANPKESWQKQLSMTFDDPQTEAFMRAGQARVAAPVRLGFEAAVLRFLADGPTAVINDENGSLPTDVESTPEIPVWQQVIEQQGATLVEPQPYGNPWQFKIPTGHQIIRSVDTLPAPGA